MNDYMYSRYGDSFKSGGNCFSNIFASSHFILKFEVHLEIFTCSLILDILLALHGKWKCSKGFLTTLVNRTERQSYTSNFMFQKIQLITQRQTKGEMSFSKSSNVKSLGMLPKVCCPSLFVH